jgi:hypothetical protein
MKTLADHIIIYDDECPLCSLYTDGFVKSGMLDANGRKAFSAVAKNNILNIDLKRACNEIALVNTKDNSVRYGIDSLTFVIGNSIPLFRRVFSSKPLRLIMNQLYFFISYNRKVIAPGKVFELGNQCVPSFNLTHRCLYILFTWLITSLVLVYYSWLAYPLVPGSNFYREFIVCGGQIVFQGFIVGVVRRDRLIHYLGNVMTVSFGGALLLTPMFLLRDLIVSNHFYIGYLMIVAGLMFLEHMRRVKALALPWVISATWVLYRLLILFFIL